VAPLTLHPKPDNLACTSIYYSSTSTVPCVCVTDMYAPGSSSVIWFMTINVSYGTCTSFSCSGVQSTCVERGWVGGRGDLPEGKGWWREAGSAGVRVGTGSDVGSCIYTHTHDCLYVRLWYISAGSLS